MGRHCSGLRFTLSNFDNPAVPSSIWMRLEEAEASPLGRAKDEVAAMGGEPRPDGTKLNEPATG